MVLSGEVAENENTGRQYTPSILDFLGCLAVPLWKEWPLEMEAVGLSNDGKFSLRGECPHCHHDSVFVQVTNNCVQFEGRYGGGTNWILAAVMRCQGCLMFVLGIVEHLDGSGTYRYMIHYPVGEPDDKASEEIPLPIREDFQEALRCLFIKAYNATGEMCRRAIEASCLDLGAPKKDVLEDMIDWLEEKRIITPGLKDVAHKVRLGGNRCAHPAPSNNGDTATLTPQTNAAVTTIEKIGKEHAEAIVDFTRHFFQYVYVTPKQLNKYDFSKPKAKVSKP